MSRSLQTANATATASDFGYGKVYFVELDFDGGTVFANSSAYSFTVNGNIYPGVGFLGEITTIEESVDNQAYSASLTLNGVDAANIELAINTTFQNRPGKISIGFTSASGALVATPDVIFAGLCDVMVISLDDALASIQLTIGDPRLDWDRPRISRYTDQDQQYRFPGDTFFSFVTGLQDRVVIWGAPGTGGTSG